MTPGESSIEGDNNEGAESLDDESQVRRLTTRRLMNHPRLEGRGGRRQESTGTQERPAVPECLLRIAEPMAVLLAIEFGCLQLLF